MLIGGIIAIAYGGWIIAIGSAASTLIPGFGAGIMVCGGIELVFGLLSVLGAVMALRRSSWGLALVGALFCMLSMGPMFIASILGLIALILVAISRQDFM
jgi:hypothetical protein